MDVNYVFVGLLLVLFVYAFARGGGPEKVGVGIYAAGSALTYFEVETSHIHYSGVEVGIFVIDIFVFIGFVLVALRANRYWPIWVSALVGVGVVGHLAMLLHPRVIPWAYAVVLSIWSYPIMLVMAVGTYAHHRRLTRTGADPSWTRSFAPPGPPKPPPGPKR